MAHMERQRRIAMDRRKNTKTFKNYSILILILIIMMVMNAGAATFTSTLPMEPDTPVFPFGGEFTITLPAGFLDIELKDNEYFVYPPKTNSQELQNELLAKGILALSPPCGAGDVGNGIDKNLNMLDFKTNDWTQINPVDNQEWFHSDVKDKAFFYIHTFFKELLK
jgi:hypothetical protein